MASPRLLQICLSNSWGGLEMTALEIAKSYSTRGIFVRTACPPDSRLHEALNAEKLPTLTLNARSYFDPHCILQLRRSLIQDATTAVILQQLKDIWHARPALLCRPDIELIGFAHIFLSVQKKDFLHGWLYHRMNTLICLTGLQKKNFATALPIAEDRIVIIPNSVDLRAFSPANRDTEMRRILGAENEKQILIGVIGRLDEMKGQLEMVAAARPLRDAGLDFKVALIGEETLNLVGTKARLQSMIREYSLENTVHLAGYRSDIPRVIASLDILAMPSYAETFGRVLLEAMASGTPTIATAAGGVPDIIDDGQTGLLVPPRDSQALADAITRYLNEPGLRDKIRALALEKARTIYSLERVQKQMDDVLLR